MRTATVIIGAGHAGLAMSRRLTERSIEPTLTLDLSREQIQTIIWATGYRPDYAWIDIPVVGRNGQILRRPLRKACK